MKYKATLFALLAASAPLSQAQTIYTWDGGNYSGNLDNNWGTAINWSPDTVPVKSSNTVLTFSGNEKATANNNLGDWALDIGQLNFNSTAMQSFLTGNAFGFLPLNGSQQINQNSPNGAQIGNTFAFRSGSDSQINLNASGPLLVHSSVYLDASSGTARQLVIGGTTNDLNTLVLNGTVAKSGSGYDPDVTIQNNKRVAVFGSLTFGSGTDGSVMINSGRLEFHGTGSMTGAPVIGNASGSDNAMLLLSGAGQTMANQLEIRGGSTGRRVIGGQNTSGNVTFSGTIIGNNAPASYDVVAATGGSVTLSGTRNFNSELSINRPDGGTAYGGTVVLGGDSSNISRIFLYDGILQAGAMSQLGSASGGMIFYGGKLKLSAAFNMSREIALTGGSAGIDTSAVANDARPTFDGSVQGNGNLTIAANGSVSGGTTATEGGTVFNGSNSNFTGSTTITSGVVYAYYGLGSNGNLTTLNGGGLASEGAYTTNINRGIELGASGGFFRPSLGSTLTLNRPVSGAGQLTKSGSGTLVLVAENSFTGVTNVNKGVISLANTRALASSIVNRGFSNATLSFDVAGNNIYHLGGLIGAQITQIGGNTLSLGGTNLDSYTRMKLAGTGGLIKAGTGKLTLSSSDAQSYTGATTVSAGTLVVDGSLAAASAVQVYPGATLAGSGTVAGSVLVSGTISPGDNGIGTLNTGSVLLYGTWACDITGTACDVLAVTGDFFTGATSRLVVTGTPTADRYVIATYTGNLGAVASSESPVLPSGYEFAVDMVNKQLLVVKSAVTTSPYATWSASKNLVAGVNDGATQDPDGDGTSNLLEFALGGNPLASDTSISPVETLTADNLEFTFRRSDDSEQEVSLGFQTGSDLTTWTEVAIGATGAGSVGIVENGADPDTVTLTLPRANAVGGKLFGRLKAALKTAP